MDLIPRPRERRDERRLLRIYSQTRDPQVLEALVLRYQPLARSLAMRYQGSSEPLDDLLQVADLGLVKSIQGFDPDRERTFTAYAVPTILGELKRHFRDKVWNLRLPRGLQESSAKVSKASEQLTTRLRREPLILELAQHCGLNEEEVMEALVAADAHYTRSLNAPSSSDSEAPALIDQICDHEYGFDRVEADWAVTEAGLDARERTVLKLAFNEGMRQVDIGEQVGISQMQVSRVVRTALEKLLRAVQGGDSVATQPATWCR